MPTTVYLMRHGEVANGGEKRYNGHYGCGHYR